MGYCMVQRAASFFIASDKQEDALLALRSAPADLFPSWLTTKISESTSLEEALLEAEGWDVTVEDGDIIDILFVADKYGGEEVTFFNVIAPFVREGSFIEMTGVGGADLWRWVFKNGKCSEINAKITWE